jgi:hypothetical protein
MVEENGMLLARPGKKRKGEKALMMRQQGRGSRWLRGATSAGGGVRASKAARRRGAAGVDRMHERRAAVSAWARVAR